MAFNYDRLKDVASRLVERFGKPELISRSVGRLKNEDQPWLGDTSGNEERIGIQCKIVYQTYNKYKSTFITGDFIIETDKLATIVIGENEVLKNGYTINGYRILSFTEVSPRDNKDSRIVIKLHLRK